MRAILRGEDPPPGEKFRTGFHFMGYEPLRPDMPIYLAGLSPGMLRLAGEIADGVMLWLCNPNYIRDVVVPTVAEGREKAGKELDGLRHRGGRSVRGDRRPRRGARSSCARSSSRTSTLPYYRAMIERSGFDTRPTRGQRPTSSSGCSAAIGSAEEAIASVRRYRDSGATSPCVGGIAGTDFDATLEALAKSLD